jgi:hypothetical protein
LNYHFLIVSVQIKPILHLIFPFITCFWLMLPSFFTLFGFRFFLSFFISFSFSIMNFRISWNRAGGKLSLFHFAQCHS